MNEIHIVPTGHYAAELINYEWRKSRNRSYLRLTWRIDDSTQAGYHAYQTIFQRSQAEHIAESCNIGYTYYDDSEKIIRKCLTLHCSIQIEHKRFEEHIFADVVMP